MFKTEATRRIRFRYGKPGTRVHDMPVPHTQPMTTACGKKVRLFDSRDRVQDLPLSASEDIAVTCPRCQQVLLATADRAVSQGVTSLGAWRTQKTDSPERKQMT